MAGIPTWTAPRDWVDGETPTGAQFNAHLRDNLTYLKDSPTMDGALRVDGTLTAENTVTTGTSTVQTLSVAGDATVGNNLQVNQNATVNASISAGSLSVFSNTTLGDSLADTLNVKALIIGAPLRNFSETHVLASPSGGVLTIDCSLGTYFQVPLDQNCAVNVINPPPNGRAIGITIFFFTTIANATVTWTGGQMLWPGGVPPVITPTINKWDVIRLLTFNGGAAWWGVIGGQNYA